VARNDQAMDAALTLAGPVLPRARAGDTLSGVSGETQSDDELLQRIAARDRDAFDELYRRYTRPVLGLALRRLGDRGRAEDALQDAFAAIWRSARSYDPGRGTGAAWLYAVARNAIVDGARRRPEPPTEVPDTPADEVTPDERAVEAWQAWRVHRALEELPAAERQVIELAYWGGQSQSEIATFLGLPLGTVKTRTRSGLARLADVLDGELR
jgi:RNA polymerase sigma-70 factor, ECF subfamily